jgi:hypothetical protein
VAAETEAIQGVLGRYRTAFNALDASAAQQVWPTVDARTLERAFSGLAEQDLSFDSCRIDLNGVLAEATCRGRARFVPTVGSRTPQDQAREWRFSLRRQSNRGWLIEGVDAR